MKRDANKTKFIWVSMGSMLLFYGAFFLFPMAYGLVGSFTNWNPYKGRFQFIGLNNYTRMFADPLFFKSLLNTMSFTVVCVVLTTVIGLALALAVTSLKRFRSFLTTAIYMPYVTSIITIAVVWRWFYASQGGLFNHVMSAFGISGLDWLTSAQTVWPSIALMTIWHDVGYALILFIAGISEIPSTLFEAAAMDGAGRFAIFRKITIPILAPTTALVAVSGIITYVQVYDQIVALTRGGPGDASFSVSYYLFDSAIGYQRFGYASAIAMVMLIIILFLSMLQLRISQE